MYERYALLPFTWMEKDKKVFCAHNESQFGTIDKLLEQ
jgi:hypothetical protein